MSSRWSFLVVVVLFGPACTCGSGGASRPADAGPSDARPEGDAAPPGCADEDGDGAGVGRDCAAADCDDTDPLTIDECGTGCAERPARRGCPCDEGGAALVCYHGRPEEAGVGRCRPGVQACAGGVRGACDGQILPRAEQCDDQDDDCDGVADDGVGGACGGCGDCATACFGGDAACTPWPAGRGDEVSTPAPGLTLADRAADDEQVVWPASSHVTKIFKVRALTHEILGAYYTRHDRDVDYEYTRVSRAGDVLVVHQPGSWVTRIAAREADCPDRNGNGVVDTSRAWDELLAFDVENEPEDECILWEKALPERARTITLHESYGPDTLVETAWVGIDDPTGLATGFWELDATTGEQTGRTVLTPEFGPDWSAADDRGRIWAVAGGTVLAELDPDHPELGLELHELGTPVLTMTVDELGVPWVSGLGPARYDPGTGELEGVYSAWEWEQGLVPTAAGSLAPDGLGAVWHVSPEFSGPFRIDVDTLQWRMFPVGTDQEAQAIGADMLGQLWVIETDGAPGAWVLDPLDPDAAPVAALDECFPRCLGIPARGDFTGLPWALLQPRRGVWTDELVGCEEGEQVQWTRLRAAARVPRGSRVTLMVRTGADEAQLWQGSWSAAGDAADGDSEILLAPALGVDTRTHRFLALQARLEADPGAEAPTLSRIDVLFGCQRPAE